MDKYFENVVFGIEKAHFIIDEMIMSGYLTDANKSNILKPIYDIFNSED